MTMVKLLMTIKCIRPFQWPWRSTSAIQRASPNAACPGLYWKPLDTAIGQLLALYCPSGHQATGKQTMMNKYTYFAGHFDGHGDGSVRNRTHRPIEEIQDFTRSHWMLPSGKYNVQSDKRDMAMLVFLMFFIVNMLKMGA
jgi:hypothetical protein